jgi:probable HAF family extracellular repeat protein
LSLLTALTASASLADVPTFWGVGDLAGSTYKSEMFAISADGTTAVGSSEGGNGREAVRWTSGGGLVGMGVLYPLDPDSEATGVSSDGSVIVGTSRVDTGDRAFRWTSGGGMLQLGTLSCPDVDPSTSAQGVSSDGLGTVGIAAWCSGSSGTLNGALWGGGGTGITDLGDLAGGPGDFSSAEGADADASIVVGIAAAASGQNEGFWWDGSIHELPGHAGAMERSGARATSADGSIIVGYANTSTIDTGDLEATVWTGAGYTTLTLLGALPGAPSPSSDAMAITSDGSIVVGRARNADYEDVAFLWDSSGGMRELKHVIEQEYGLDIGGWELRAATGISDIGPEGEFSVVGVGRNPNGFTEGFVVYLASPECDDSVDNEPDGQTDFPNDTDCWSALDFSETPDCGDGVDNDSDGYADFPNDPECASATDQTEKPDCSDGVNNDADGFTDYPADPGCKDADMLIEDPECDDGIDNSNPLNGEIDFPQELRCTASWDLSEQFDCFDGIDNDGDGLIDFSGGDPGCDFANDQSEAAKCSDDADNDFDGKTDYPAEYPDCVGPDDNSENAQCNDGVDNDGDGLIDFAGGDTGCADANGLREAPYAFTVDDLIVVDRVSRAVFAVDPVTGTQTLISQAALLTAPQGLAQRATGELLVADPAGLVEIANHTGVQRLASAPLAAGDSLQVIVDGAGDIKVLEAAEVSDVTWNSSGIGAKSTLLSVPTGESPFPVLGVLSGDSIAWENGASTFVVGGVSVYGDGVFRVDPGTLTVTILNPTLSNYEWLDLTVESDDTILGAGVHAAPEVGVYRIDEVSGVATPLTTGGNLVRPTGITLDSDGDIFVADAGTCIGQSCTGGAIIAVDKISGTQTVLSTGGYISGEMDIMAVPEPGELGMLAAGIALLRALARRRGRVRS